MTDIERLNRNKEGIIQTLKLKGPSLPVQIAKAIEVQPLFASAFLSELKAEKRVKISNMRVGSSPIYFLPGQEEQLENFTQYLKNREKEAFSLLKKEKILEDTAQTPIIRVALRAIKDFATPLNIKTSEDKKLFWKYATISNDEAAELIKKNLSYYALENKDSIKQKAAPLENPTASQKEIPSKEEIPQKQTPPVRKIQEENQIKAPPQKHIEQHQPALQEVKKPKIQETEFSKNIKNYLNKKDIELTETLAEKKREFEAKISINTIFGKQEFYLIAKDKKNVTDNDLAIAVQKAQQEKMPAAFFSPGDLNNKGKEHLRNWGNLVKWEKLKF